MSDIDQIAGYAACVHTATAKAVIAAHETNPDLPLPQDTAGFRALVEGLARRILAEDQTFIDMVVGEFHARVNAPSAVRA